MRIELRNHLERSSSGDPADDFMPYIDTFLIDSSRDPLGGVLVLPGGGYHHRAPHEGDPVAKRFNDLGYHAFVLQYRVAPYRYPDPLRDLVRAVKLIRSRQQEWYLDKLAVLGFSAGGHLAAAGTMLADTVNANEGDEIDNFSGKADAMILCYPVISMVSGVAHCGSADYLFGEDASSRASILNMDERVDGNTPPAFLWHTADDPVVNSMNSVNFASRMWENHRDCELHIFPHGPHGKNLAPGRHDVKQWPALAAKFLEVTCGFPRA